MATNLKSKIFILALGLIFLLVPITSTAAEAVAPQPEEGGPFKVFLTGGGCLNCMKEGTRPSCNTACEMPLTAIVQNLNDHGPISVQVTMTVTFPWVPGPARCGQGDVVQVVNVDIPVESEATVDFSHLFYGSFRGATFTVTAVITDASDPELIGKTQVESIPLRTFWSFCGW